MGSKECHSVRSCTKRRMPRLRGGTISFKCQRNASLLTCTELYDSMLRKLTKRLTHRATGYQKVQENGDSRSSSTESPPPIDNDPQGCSDKIEGQRFFLVMEHIHDTALTRYNLSRCINVLFSKEAALQYMDRRRRRVRPQIQFTADNLTLVHGGRSYGECYGCGYEFVLQDGSEYSIWVQEEVGVGELGALWALR